MDTLNVCAYILWTEKVDFVTSIYREILSLEAPNYCLYKIMLLR